MQRTTTYREQSRIFLAQAWEELAAGDLAQASEKGWGAAAQMVKAIAQERGWPHQNHRQLHGIIGTLRSETGDSELVLQFGSASLLHGNFYEIEYPPEIVGDHLTQVELFVEKCEALLNGNTPA